jgi:hypothetical protein
LIEHGARLLIVTLFRSHRLVQRRIKWMAHALERSHALRFQQFRQAPVNRAQTCGDGRRRSVYMCERVLEVIKNIEQRKDDLAFTLIGRVRALPLDAPAIVVKVGDAAQVDFMLAAQIFLELLVLHLQPIDLGILSICLRVACHIPKTLLALPKFGIYYIIATPGARLA